MTENDLDFVRRLCRLRLIMSPVLELGAGYGGLTSKEVIRDHGLEYHSSDVHPGNGVDWVVDLEGTLSDEERRRRYGTVLVLNVLEHTFDPLRVLDNALSIIADGGTAVVITPAMWPIHNYPKDCYRLLPDWYIEYAKRRKVELVAEAFEYLSFGPVSSYCDSGNEFRLPLQASGAVEFYSRVIHKLFNTTGRGKWSANHVAIGAIFRKAATPCA